jgi:hypothetical protein
MMRRPRATESAVLVLCIGALLLAYFAWTVAEDVFDGIPPSIPVARVTANCRSAPGTLCGARVARLNDGRFHIRSITPTSRLIVTVDDAAAVRATHVLLVRTNRDIRVVIDDGEGGETLSTVVRPVGGRWILPLPRGAVWNRITVEPTAGYVPVVLEELGFFSNSRGLLQSTRQPLSRISGHRFYQTFVAGLALAVCAWFVAAAWYAPELTTRVGPYVSTVMCLSICILELGTLFSPYWSADIRPLYGAEQLSAAGSAGNLMTGLAEGARLIQHQGQTLAPGMVAWHRMPGYGWFCALAALIARSTDVVEIAMVTIILQAVFYSIAVGVFVRIAQPVLGVRVSSLLAVLFILLPKQLHYTQVDSIAAPLSLLVLSTLLCCLENVTRGEPVPMRVFLCVNGAFALWFAMRNDILPGWIIVAVAISLPRWRRLMVPVVLIAAIALPWALYKRQYRHEFDVMPTNTGEVLLLSLCEVPGAFPYPCDDAGYAQWATLAGYADATSQAASNRAAIETVRHWATYPVHFALMVGSKFRNAVFPYSWPGFTTRTNAIYRPFEREEGLFVVLLTVFALSLAVKHERRRSLLLGWALLLNMPIFFVVFESSGRFYVAAGISLLAAAIPPLFERPFYACLRRHPWRVAIVIGCACLFTLESRRVEKFVVAHNSLHYWTPVLDPRHSTLRFDPVAFK